MPKNDKTRKNSNNVRGPYREFDPASQAMREVLIRGYAKRYIENVETNNGKCTYGFVVGLAQESSSVTNRLRINRKDIINEATRIMAKRREVSPGTLQASSATEAVDTPGGSVTQVSVGLNLLARAAAEPRPLPPVAAASIKPTIPNDNQNKCSHRNCFIPFEPSTCCTNVLLFTLSLVNCRVKYFSFADRNESIGCRVWTSSRRS